MVYGIYARGSMAQQLSKYLKQRDRVVYTAICSCHYYFILLTKLSDYWSLGHVCEREKVGFLGESRMHGYGDDGGTDLPTSMAKVETSVSLLEAKFELSRPPHQRITTDGRRTGDCAK